MKWINNFRKFQKIKEAWTTPTNAIEHIYKTTQNTYQPKLNCFKGEYKRAVW